LRQDNQIYYPTILHLNIKDGKNMNLRDRNTQKYPEDTLNNSELSGTINCFGTLKVVNKSFF